jgi:hypothetical protein
VRRRGRKKRAKIHLLIRETGRRTLALFLKISGKRDGSFLWALEEEDEKGSLFVTLGRGVGRMQSA